VVAPDKGHAVRIAHFEAEEEKKGLDRVEAAVDKVTWGGDGCAVSGGAGSDARGVASVRGQASHTHKEIVGVWWVAADAKELHQVVELAVDVAAYLRGNKSGTEPKERASRTAANHPP
jgi:hypothetical protein